ncbi:MAG: helix-turn-helix transcriptional regulator [Spirochaetes bacterium]|nr:helix-turn-helix transcriptional regulator [Spirochaetota bacterium]
MDNSAAAIISCDETVSKGGHRFRRESGFPYYTFGCLLSGRSQKRMSSGVYEYTPVCFTVTPPNTPYAVYHPIAHRELWYIFSIKPEWRSLLRWGTSADVIAQPLHAGVEHRAEQRQIIRHLRDTIAHYRSPLPHAMRMAELSFEQALILVANLAGSHGSIDERIERVIDSLRRRPAQHWGISEMAETAGLSPSRFSHIFHEELGIAPAKFLDEVRFEKAKSLLLSTEQSVQDIAAAVGYYDPLHFSSRFRRIAGLSPAYFRRKEKKK